MTYDLLKPYRTTTTTTTSMTIIMPLLEFCPPAGHMSQHKLIDLGGCHWARLQIASSTSQYYYDYYYYV